MPHLYELRPLPTEVGGVPIAWLDPSKVKVEKGRDEWKLLARQEKGQLLLPIYPENDFLPLVGGKLLLINHGTNYASGRRNSFCGRDESPFHAFVTEEAVKAYKEGGSEGFFESLVPKLIKELRERPDIPDSYVRQGDWFTNRLPFSWLEIEQFVRLGRGKEFDIVEVKKESLGGTRHHFTGRLVREVPIFGWKCLLLEGVLSAPDHKDLVLSGGPHVIAQAANLADPENAE